MVVLLLALLLSGCASGARSQADLKEEKTVRPGNYLLNIKVGTLERHYVVHVPQRYDGKAPTPVLVMFHGGGGTARGVMKETAWSAKADRENFIAVFPEGTRPNPSRRARFIGNPQTWNDGSKRPTLWAVRREIDDVSFVGALIDDLIIRFNVDERRIYASGFSNGASLAFRLGHELSERFAAIAPVAGSDWIEEQSAISQPISLIYITGTEDPLNPLSGGKIMVGSKSYGEKPPVREMIQKWAKMMGCPLEARIIYDKNGVRGIAYGPGDDDSEVVLYTIEEMGHTWPGGTSLLPESMVGKTSNRLNGCDVIWAFFQKHPKK